MNIEESLKNRHTARLEWSEPWPAMGADGHPVTASITLRATVHDCINLARIEAIRHDSPTRYDDAALLRDFISVFWAYVVQDAEMLTPSEIALLRQKAKEASTYAKKVFRKRRG